MNYDLLSVFIIASLLTVLVIIFLRYRLVRKEYIKSLNINRTLIEISNQIPQFKDMDELYQKMLEYTIKLIKGAQYGSILIYDKLNDRMNFKALSGYNVHDFSKTYLKKEELFLYTLNKLKEPGIIINPLVHSKHLYDPYENEILKNSNQYIYKSILSAPLYIDGEFFGCIGVDNIETINAFSKEDIEIIKYISVHLEIVIKNMLLVDKIKHSLITDPLTGLSNRRYYNTLVDCDFNNRNLSNTVFAMIDMDNFKAVNDTYGHLKGDEALRYFSELLKSRFRKDDTIIRYAGDEFLLILYDFDVESVKKKLSDIIKELDVNPFCGIKISFSYGVSRFAAGTGAEEAIKQADRNMYHQKSSKRAI